MKHQIFKKVNDSYFWNIWPANTWLFGHISLDIWIRIDDWRFYSISKSSANDAEYYCIIFYLGALNVSYTWMA